MINMNRSYDNFLLYLWRADTYLVIEIPERLNIVAVNIPTITKKNKSTYLIKIKFLIYIPLWNISIK